MDEDFKKFANFQMYNGVDSSTEETIKNLAKDISVNSGLKIDNYTTSSSKEVESILSDLEGVDPTATDLQDQRLNPSCDTFSSSLWVKNLAAIINNNPEYYKPYSLDCIWQNLSAYGETSGIESQANLINAPQKIINSVYRTVKPVKKEKSFTILKEMEGCINPG